MEEKPQPVGLWVRERGKGGGGGIGVLVCLGAPPASCPLVSQIAPPGRFAAPGSASSLHPTPHVLVAVTSQACCGLRFASLILLSPSFRGQLEFLVRGSTRCHLPGLVQVLCECVICTVSRDWDEEGEAFDTFVTLVWKHALSLPSGARHPKGKLS